MEEKKDKKIIAILRGGSGFHYEDSLIEGSKLIQYILDNFSDQWKVLDVFIDKNNLWHVNGVPKAPEDIASEVDLVWNTSYPSFAQFFEILSVPVVGSKAFSFSLKKDRPLFLKNTKIDNIKIPNHIVLPVYQKDFDGPQDEYIVKKAKEVFEKFCSPWLVKPFTSNSFKDEYVAHTFPQLVKAIEDGVKNGKSILIEEFIAGNKGTVHTVSGFRGEENYSFSEDNLSLSEKEKLINLAKNVHKYFDLPYYLKSEFILSPRRGVFLNDFELIPDLIDDSHLDRSCSFVGAKTKHLIEHILDSTL